MSTCPKCKHGSVICTLKVGGKVGLECRKCFHTWTLATVPEPYLRELIARSLELAALKSKT